MSKAKKEERQPHGVLPDVDLGPAIDQFRAIATQSGDALFTEGSVNCRATIKVRVRVNQGERVSGAWAEGRA
jgi:hypothetical protein